MGDSSIGERIRLCRGLLNLSQEALARELRVSKNTVSRWELGFSPPSLASIKYLTQRIGPGHAAWLVTGKGASPAEAA